MLFFQVRYLSLRKQFCHQTGAFKNSYLATAQSRSRQEWSPTLLGTPLSRPWVLDQNLGHSPTCYSYTSKPTSNLPVGRLLHLSITVRLTLPPNLHIPHDRRETLKHRMLLHRDQERGQREQVKRDHRVNINARIHSTTKNSNTIT